MKQLNRNNQQMDLFDQAKVIEEEFRRKLDDMFGIPEIPNERKLVMDLMVHLQRFDSKTRYFLRVVYESTFNGKVISSAQKQYLGSLWLKFYPN